MTLLRLYLFFSKFFKVAKYRIRFECLNSAPNVVSTDAPSTAALLCKLPPLQLLVTSFVSMVFRLHSLRGRDGDRIHCTADTLTLINSDAASSASTELAKSRAQKIEKNTLCEKRLSVHQFITRQT